MDIYTKWSPIMDALKVTDKKTRKIMAKYAEFHMKHDIENQIHFVKNENDDITQNLLPVSMKILALLNIKDKNVILTEGLPTLSFDVEIDKEQIRVIKESDDSELSSTMVQQLERILVDKLVEYINKELETKDNLYLTTLAQSISIISSEEWKPRMYLHSRIRID